MISVVYVHTYDMLGVETPWLYALRLMILAVQMPLFLFLCGYFGKNLEKRRNTALTEYLIPFLVCNTLYYIIRVKQVDVLKFSLLRPLNMYWFLMTLLIIRLLMPELIRIRGIFPFSILLALAAGGDKHIGRTLSLSRTICFFPFYLMGYYCSEKQIKRIRQMPVIVALLCGALGTYLTFWLTKEYKPDLEHSHPFQLVNCYKTQGLEPFEGVLFRFMLYIIAPLMGILILRLMSQRKSLLTRIGQGSMTVYLFHAFPLLWIVEKWGKITKVLPWIASKEFVKMFGGFSQFSLITIYAVVISCLLSCKPIVWLYDWTLQRIQWILFRHK